MPLARAATRAARRAGFRTEVWRTQVTALLRHKEVRAALGAAMAARPQRTGITRARARRTGARRLRRDRRLGGMGRGRRAAQGQRRALRRRLRGDREIATDADGSAVAVRLHDKGAALALARGRGSKSMGGRETGGHGVAPERARAPGPWSRPASPRCARRGEGSRAGAVSAIVGWAGACAGVTRRRQRWPRIRSRSG